MQSSYPYDIWIMTSDYDTRSFFATVGGGGVSNRYRFDGANRYSTN